MAANLAAWDTVTVLPRTTVFGVYDHNVFGLVESTNDHLPAPAPHQPRQRFWIVRAAQAVLATGAVERPLVFAGNDLPGVMLASAARAYVNRYAVTPGPSGGGLHQQRQRLPDGHRPGGCGRPRRGRGGRPGPSAAAAGAAGR